MKSSLFLLLLFFVAIIEGCNFIAGEEYTCLPCGGIYACTSTGGCGANSGDVPGCTLPIGAQNWVCCTTSTCDVKGTDLCYYTAPQPSNPAPGEDCEQCQERNYTAIIIGVAGIIGISCLCCLVLLFVVMIVTKSKNKNNQYPPLQNQYQPYSQPIHTTEEKTEYKYNYNSPENTTDPPLYTRDSPIVID